jgi:hypothetical protein
MARLGRQVDSYGLSDETDIWEAIRRFFAKAATVNE